MALSRCQTIRRVKCEEEGARLCQGWGWSKAPLKLGQYGQGVGCAIGGTLLPLRRGTAM